MPVRVLSSIVLGIDTYPVVFEVAVSSGPARFTITGLPQDTTAESQSHIGKAIPQIGGIFPILRRCFCVGTLTVLAVV
jgi:hypothetical protein